MFFADDAAGTGGMYSPNRLAILDGFTKVVNVAGSGIA